MKANELSAKDLMVGDLVYLSSIMSDDKYTVQVLEIQDDCIKYYCGGKKMMVRFKYIEPIPITTEILEKNGFEVTRNMSSSGNKDVWSLRVSKNKVFHIIEHHNKRKFPYFWIELGSNSDIKYVHQLQHALRLCGIEKEIEL